MAGIISVINAAPSTSPTAPTTTTSVSATTTPTDNPPTFQTTNPEEQKAIGEEATSQASTQELFNLISGNTAASPDTETEMMTETPDSFSGYNHVVFKINDKLDKVIAKPAAHLYIKIVPRPLTNMINNAFDNVDNIPTIANDLMQANFYQATSDSWRLIINSTLGVGGAFDVAAQMGLAYNYEDFGLTLAQWGWTSSSYFIIPILGPSTVRDGLGRIVNYQLSIFPYIEPASTRWGIYILFLLNQRVQFLKAEDLYNSAAIAPYAFMRNAYLQRRAYLINRNKELNNPYTKKDMQKYYNPYYLYQ